MTLVETCPDCGGDLLPDAILTKLRCPSCEPAAPLPAPAQPALPAPGWRNLPNTPSWHWFDGSSAESVCGNVWCTPSLRGEAPAAYPSVTPDGYLSVCPDCKRATP